MTSDPLAKARAAWGEEMPDWVALLASACATASQNQVAKRLGVSATLISNVLASKYTGDMTRVEDLVRGAYARQVMDCPALGDLPTDVCRRWRLKARKLNSANSLNVTMFRACRRCPVHRGGENEQ